MAKRVAVLAVNPVNGLGLFQYLESFYENQIIYRVYAVAETTDMRTNSGIRFYAEDKSICHWAGVFYKEDTEHKMTQCQRCDYL